MFADGHVTIGLEPLAEIDRLRQARRRLIGMLGAEGLQQRAVAAISEIASRWRMRDFGPRQAAQMNPGAFPLDMIAPSLDSLLDSLSRTGLDALIDGERCRAATGAEVIAHVVASNTPFVGWSSLIRALLVGSASLVKAPTSFNAVWLTYFAESLALVSAELGNLVSIAHWSGGDAAIESAVFPSADLVVVYGDNDTIESVRSRSAATPVLGYGHRVSVGFVQAGADFYEAARGTSLDVAIFDQGGCLSPQTLFVEGGGDSARQFGEQLADSLAVCAIRPHERDTAAAGMVHETRELAKFDPSAVVHAVDGFRATVIVRDDGQFAPSPGFGVVNVSSWAGNDVHHALHSVRGQLQGASIAGVSETKRNWLLEKLPAYGISYHCKPGCLQTPPISWRENGIDVLTALLIR